MMTNGQLPTPPPASEGTGRASEATVFLPTPLHWKAEEYAATRFKRLVRPDADGLSREQCFKACDGIGMSGTIAQNTAFSSTRL